MKQKGFVVPYILIAILIASGLIFVYQEIQFKSLKPNTPSNSPSAQPSPTVTAISTPSPEFNSDPGHPGWKIMKDGLQGFQISFPGSWTYINDLLYSGYKPQNKGGFASSDDITLLVTTDGHYDGFPKAILNREEELFNIALGAVNDAHQKKLANLAVGGFPAVYYLQEPKRGTEGTNSYIYLVKINNQTHYLIMFSSLENDNSAIEKHRAEIDQVLASFKLSTQPNEKVVYQTYQDKTYGFEFQYPTNWTAGGNQYTLLSINDAEGNIRLALDKDPSTAQGCGGIQYDEALLTESIQIADQTIKLKDLCSRNFYSSNGPFYLLAKSGQKLYLDLYKLDTIGDSKTREILKSLKGLSLPN